MGSADTGERIQGERLNVAAYEKNISADASHLN